LIAYQDKPELKQSDLEQYEYAVHLAERAAQLASEGGLRAEAVGAAGMAQWKLADAPSEDENRKITLRKNSLANLAAAIRLDAGCRAPHGVVWRLLFPSIVLIYGDASQQNGFRQEMLHWLTEADKVVPVNDAERKPRIRNLLDKLEKLGQ